MADENKYSLINRLDMRSINNELTYLFQKYSMVLNKIVGDELIGNSQIREIYAEDNGVFKEYSKGQIRFKNGIDTLRYLLDHRASVAKLIGVSAEDIKDNKRELAKVKDYLNRLRGVCEVGDMQSPIQMYISKKDGNIGGLDDHSNWVDYILTHGWIDKLATKSIGGEYSPFDYRIEYLADLIEGKIADHEIDYHKYLAVFETQDFLSKSVVDGKVKYKVEDVMNRLNSFGKLDYGFYEIFKPIGGGKGKHVKVKLSTDGYADVSGVVGLSDCIHWEWEYGSEAYLRSLNTGNQRYLFQLDQPFNDGSSTLWWRPDESTPPQKMEANPVVDDDTPQPTKWYFKPYETERFLRWYGTDHIPTIDESTLEKCSVCSSPELSNDTQSENFHTDARNISEMDIDLTTTNIDASTSQSLLSLYPKATLAVRTYVCETDEDGKKTFREPTPSDRQGDIHQYLEFVVTGNRQTYNVSFDIRGKVDTSIQESNHYLHTMGEIVGEWHRLYNTMLFLEISAIIVPEIKTVWGSLKQEYSFDEPWVPENWIYLEGKFRELLELPTIVDILRVRQLDVDTIIKNDDVQYGARIDGIKVGDTSIQGFLVTLSGEDGDKEEYINTHCKGDQKTKYGLYSLMRSKKFLGDDDDCMLQALYDYIFNFEGAATYEELSGCYRRIRLTDSQKENLVRQPLVKMYGDKMSKSERRTTRIRYSYNGNWVKCNISGKMDVDALVESNLAVKDEDGKPMWRRKPYAIEIGDDVTSIGEWAFLNCKTLATVKIPDSVEEVGVGAFEGCSGLVEVTFANKTFTDVTEMDNFPWDSERNDFDIFNRGTFADVTPDVLRERITTYNNLIVRLPVDSEHNCLASKRIFLDWKAFVDGAARELVERKKLFVKYKPIEPGEDEQQWLVESGRSTDGKVYPFTELYIDEDTTTPLVDYSYIVVQDGKANFDRWDYWSENDFNWPQ